MIDLHIHILPGLDDGAASWEQALEMGRLAFADGTRALVATPHLLCDVGNPGLPAIHASVRELGNRLREAELDLQVRAGGEIRLVEDLVERLDRGELPTLDEGGRYVLIEPPHLGDCFDALATTVFRLRCAGRIPVIAHPERTETLGGPAHMQRYERLRDQGALFQITAQSIVDEDRVGGGFFLRGVLENGFAHVVASDAHHPTRRPPCLSAAYSVVQEWLGAEWAEVLFRHNPERVWSGESVREIPVLPRRTTPDASMWSRLRRFFR